MAMSMLGARKGLEGGDLSKNMPFIVMTVYSNTAKQ